MFDNQHRSADQGLIKYDIKQKKSSLFMSYNQIFGDTFFDASNHSMALDPIENMVYLNDGDGTVFIINLTTKEVEHISTEHKAIGGYHRGIFIHNEYHIIGGMYSKKHLKWNKDKQEYDILHADIHDELGLSFDDFAWIYDENQDMLHCLGCCDGLDESLFIYSYSFGDKKWMKSEKELQRLMDSGCQSGIMAPDGEYVWIFYDFMEGAEDNKRKYLTVLKLEDMSLKRSKIELPDDGRYHAVMMSNGEEKNELLLYGFVRNELDLDVPEDVMRVILAFYCVEYVYLFDRDYGTEPQWRICVQDIIDNLNRD